MEHWSGGNQLEGNISTVKGTDRGKEEPYSGTNDKDSKGLNKVGTLKLWC